MHDKFNCITVNFERTQYGIYETIHLNTTINVGLTIPLSFIVRYFPYTSVRLQQPQELISSVDLATHQKDEGRFRKSPNLRDVI